MIWLLADANFLRFLGGICKIRSEIDNKKKGRLRTGSGDSVERRGSTTEGSGEGGRAGTLRLDLFLQKYHELKLIAVAVPKAIESELPSSFDFNHLLEQRKYLHRCGDPRAPRIAPRSNDSEWERFQEKLQEFAKIKPDESRRLSGSDLLLAATAVFAEYDGIITNDQAFNHEKFSEAAPNVAVIDFKNFSAASEGWRTIRGLRQNPRRPTLFSKLFEKQFGAVDGNACIGVLRERSARVPKGVSPSLQYDHYFGERVSEASTISANDRLVAYTPLGISELTVKSGEPIHFLGKRFSTLSCNDHRSLLTIARMRAIRCAKSLHAFFDDITVSETRLKDTCEELSIYFGSPNNEITLSRCIKDQESQKKALEQDCNSRAVDLKSLRTACALDLIAHKKQESELVDEITRLNGEIKKYEVEQNRLNAIMNLWKQILKLNELRNDPAISLIVKEEPTDSAFKRLDLALQSITGAINADVIRDLALPKMKEAHQYFRQIRSECQHWHEVKSWTDSPYPGKPFDSFFCGNHSYVAISLDVVETIEDPVNFHGGGVIFRRSK